MSLILLKTGEAMPLFAQLGDSEEGKHVRATLRDAAGAPYSTPTVALTDRGGGLYTNNAILLSGAGPILVTYEVFDDAGFTTPAKHYADIDIVMTVDFGEVVRKDHFIAVLEGSEIAAVLADNSMTFETYEELIEGVIAAPALVGEIENNDLTFNIRCGV